jgi:hypothetical protein
VNWGNNLEKAYFYAYPAFAGAGALADSAGQIAAPGRFPLDLTTLRTAAANEGWNDVGANLMEMAATEGGSNSFCDFANQAPGETLSASCQYSAGGGAPTQLGVLRRANGVATSVWQGGSWEGHGSFDPVAAIPFRREWYGAFSAATQYGKTGFRCVYPN